MEKANFANSISARSSVERSVGGNDYSSHKWNAVRVLYMADRVVCGCVPIFDCGIFFDHR